MRFSYILASLIIHCFFLLNQASAQYYYRDIWTNQQVNKEFGLLKSDGIRAINLKSFEADGSESEGFFAQKKIDKNYLSSQMNSKSNVTEQSILITYYSPDGKVLKTIDSTSSTSSHTDYRYDGKGRLKKVIFYSRADEDSTAIGEEHEYFYSTTGLLTGMIKKKMNNPYSTISFKSDDKGNVTDEEETVKGESAKKYYYYYDDSNRLTDVVHFNDRLGKLIPDFAYQYNEQGLADWLTITKEGTSDYVIWRYHYNEHGLRDIEKLFSKDKKIVGTIEYQYIK
jgi:hypothetical protein